MSNEKALTSNQCPACERAMSLLQLYGVPPERARTVVNGIEVLMTRSRKEAVAVNETIARLRAALAGMIEAVRSVEISGDEWREHVGDRLARAYRAVGPGLTPQQIIALEQAALSGDSSAPETKTDEYRVSRRVMNCIYNALQDYANEATYLPPRIGGILQGCPRGDSPTPTQLAGNARLVVNLIDREVLGRSAQETESNPETKALIDQDPYGYTYEIDGVSIDNLYTEQHDAERLAAEWRKQGRQAEVIALYDHPAPVIAPMCAVCDHNEKMHKIMGASHAFTPKASGQPATEVEIFDGESHIHRLPAKPCTSCFGDKQIAMSDGSKRRCEYCGGTGIEPAVNGSAE